MLLTNIDIMQAEELGKVFRCMYPGGQGMLEPSKALLSSAVSLPSLSLPVAPCPLIVPVLVPSKDQGDMIIAMLSLPPVC